MTRIFAAIAATLLALGIGKFATGRPDVVAPAAGPVAVERVAAGIVSTDRNETFPALDPVTGSLWFSVYDDSFGAQTIMFSPRTDGAWAVPEVASFSGNWGDRAPRFSPDGSNLYFASNRPLTGAGPGADMNLWRVRRSGDAWGPAEPLEPPVNSAANDMHASVTDSALWFASNREGSLGRSDIYRVDEEGVLVHLPVPINSQLSQPDLWVSADESWMILVLTEHPDGHGGDDLYLSRFDGDAWSQPENLGPQVNSGEYDYGPVVSADNQYLYFTSHRDGSADVYRVRLSLVIN